MRRVGRRIGLARDRVGRLWGRRERAVMQTDVFGTGSGEEAHAASALDSGSEHGGDALAQPVCTGEVMVLETERRRGRGVLRAVVDEERPGRIEIAALDRMTEDSGVGLDHPDLA